MACTYVNDIAWIIPLVCIVLLLFYCVCCCYCTMNNQSRPRNRQRRNRVGNDGDNGTDLEGYDNWSDNFEGDSNGFDGASFGGSGGTEWLITRHSIPKHKACCKLEKIWIPYVVHKKRVNFLGINARRIIEPSPDCNRGLTTVVVVTTCGTLESSV